MIGELEEGGREAVSSSFITSTEFVHIITTTHSVEEYLGLPRLGNATGHIPFCKVLELTEVGP